MAITLADFNKIWASTSPLTPYSFSEANYKRGWNFVGSTPPARQMWDSYMKASDEKHQWLYNNKLSLSGGTMTGGLTASSIAFIPSFSPNIYVNQDYSDLKMYGGTAVHKGGDLQLFGKDSSLLPGYFRLAADDGTNRKQLIGTPGGSLTWDNNDIALVKDVLPLAGGTMAGSIACSRTDFRIYASSNAQAISILGGTTFTDGAFLRVFGKDYTTASDAGVFSLASCDANGGRKYFVGKPDGTLTWGSQPILYGPTASFANNGYFTINHSNTAIQWRRENIGAGASYTWTFPRPFGADNQYTRFVSSENACTVTATATTLTVTNNGSAAAEVNMLVIGLMAS